VHIARYTALQTGAAVLASLVISTVLLEVFSEGIGALGVAAALLAPLLLAGPMIFRYAMRQRQLQRAYAELAAAAARDSLTGCLNHGSFVSAVTGALEAGQGGSLLVVDADYFKTINDRFGHAIGDAALQRIAAAIRDHAGEQAIVGRLGGEEFGVFAPLESVSLAKLLGETIRAAVETITLEAADPAYRLSVSIGGAATRGHARFGTLFRVADAELYRAKGEGRNAVRIAPRPVEAEEPAFRVSA